MGEPLAGRADYLRGATSMGSRWDIYAGGGSYLGTHPSVSPDGISIVYSTPATGHGDIYRFDRTTAKNVRLTTDREYDGYPLFSRDGRHVVFEHETNGTSHLYVMDADGKKPEAAHRRADVRLRRLILKRRTNDRLLPRS